MGHKEREKGIKGVKEGGVIAWRELHQILPTSSKQ
jgi:hypothetical protein